MLVIVLTVSVLAGCVIVLVVMALVLLLQSDGNGSLVPGCHVEPMFLLQLPSGLISLCFHLSQSFSNKLLLRWVQGRG